ncbi:uncharacterized protein CANTADRAFT_19564 [Suhomyces tanzawaensis NRRL Y-17324]|uniref:Uncharacterized protein n=1 Tax=Suhomyces tanzawaensis NRRL Y-17324 TaxID=984487 RepID=A0A1E4SR22_9ASCO|nr:uncharacterized protein CANTADRAFT_19564 [Suhomyces tanzawaensis NRRL Y-17324]ODV81963.1 hypothetical protein CANTADRAFT_19564 [Suhomyces tanzawaensis NRRL Y-17324]
MKFAVLATLTGILSFVSAHMYAIRGFENHATTQLDDPWESIYYKDLTVFNLGDPENFANSMAKLQAAHEKGNHGDVFYWYNMLTAELYLYFRRERTEQPDVWWSDELSRLASVYGVNYVNKLYDTSEEILTLALDLFFHGNQTIVESAYMPGKSVVHFGNNLQGVPEQVPILAKES